MQPVFTGAGILLLLQSATIAADAATPLPRPKPSVPVASQTAAPVRSAIPLPRPKPTPGAPRRQASTDTDQPLKAGRRGRLEVRLDDLGRERDPNVASDLAPSEKSRWTETQIKTARDRCTFVLAATNLDARPIDPIGGPKGCGIAAPVKISSFGAIKVRPAATLNCTLAATLYKWLVEEVQPAALKGFKQPVVELHNMASYQCRSRRGVGGGRISEHSFGNALDIGSFKLASGDKVSVLDHWSSTASFFGVNAKAKFLTRAHQRACKSFATVLGPKANKAHENHFHFDLGRDGRYKICK